MPVIEYGDLDPRVAWIAEYVANYATVRRNLTDEDIAIWFGL